MDITEVSIIHHIGIVLLVIWLLSSFNYCHPLFYFISLIYLYLVSKILKSINFVLFLHKSWVFMIFLLLKVHENLAERFRRKVRFEERKQANQKRVNLLIHFALVLYFYLIESCNDQMER